jgi:hypothetical protein
MACGSVSGVRFKLLVQRQSADAPHCFARRCFARRYASQVRLCVKYPLPGVGDHHPNNFDLPLAGAHGPWLFGREATAHEPGDHIGIQAVREHDRFGAAKRTTGEQLERPALN